MMPVRVGDRLLVGMRLFLVVRGQRLFLVLTVMSPTASRVWVLFNHSFLGKEVALLRKALSIWAGHVALLLLVSHGLCLVELRASCVVLHSGHWHN